MLLAVAAGAFGAHALRETLTDDMKAIYETAVRYHAWHALALFGVAWLAERLPGRPVPTAGWLLIAAFAARLLPALRATHVDPATARRSE